MVDRRYVLSRRRTEIHPSQEHVVTGITPKSERTMKMFGYIVAIVCCIVVSTVSGKTLPLKELNQKVFQQLLSTYFLATTRKDV